MNSVVLLYSSIRTFRASSSAIFLWRRYQEYVSFHVKRYIWKLNKISNFSTIHMGKMALNVGILLFAENFKKEKKLFISSLRFFFFLPPCFQRRLPSSLFLFSLLPGSTFPRNQGFQRYKFYRYKSRYTVKNTGKTVKNVLS